MRDMLSLLGNALPIRERDGVGCLSRHTGDGSGTNPGTTPGGNQLTAQAIFARPWMSARDVARASCQGSARSRPRFLSFYASVAKPVAGRHFRRAAMPLGRNEPPPHGNRCCRSDCSGSCGCDTRSERSSDYCGTRPHATPGSFRPPPLPGVNQAAPQLYGQTPKFASRDCAPHRFSSWGGRPLPQATASVAPLPRVQGIRVTEARVIRVQR